jgi:hypothetical protein
MEDDVIKEKMCCGVNNVVEGGHGFFPLGEVIEFHDNVLVSIAGWRVRSHEINAPFSKGVDGDDWV